MRHPLASSRRHSSTRRRAAVAVLLIAAVATACQPAVAGRRCSGNGFGHDNSHVLQCRKGRWTRIMTFGAYLRLVDELNRKAAEEAERRASSDARAQVLRGTGTWVDVWDWSPTFLASKGSSAAPPFTLGRVDALADAGIGTIYLQTARPELPDPVLDRDLLTAIITRAHDRGMRVIGWYLPTFDRLDLDKWHLAATATLGLDGIGVDIESTVVEPVARNQRLVELSWWLRSTYPSTPLAAIVLPPVVTEILNRAYWPNFPWQQLSTSYDVWMPMSYWTNRTEASGWRDGYRYTLENIDRIRANLGNPTAAVHPIGGIANEATDPHVAGFVQAAVERGAIGASLYDDLTSNPGQYGLLAPMRRP